MCFACVCIRACVRACMRACLLCVCVTLFTDQISSKNRMKLEERGMEEEKENDE